MKRLVLMFCSLMALACSCHGEDGMVDFKTITDRVATDIMEHPTDSVMNEILSEMTADGIWPDVDYQSTASYNWSPKYHIYRLFTMSSAYIDEKSSFYQDAEVLSRIVKGLYKWKELKPVCSNWFVKAIQEPLKVGGILVLLESVCANIPDDVKSYMLALLHDSTVSPYDYNDFNRTSVAEHWIYRACVEKDAETLETAVNCIFDFQKINTGGDGYQLDGSFFHGGPQFYIGGYCSGAIETVINTGIWVRGSAYELSADNLYVLRNFLTNVYPTCVRGLVINYDCVGRGVTERNYLDASAMVTSFERMKVLDPDYTALYSHILKWLQLDKDDIDPIHNHYWIGDYTTHSRPSYNYSVGLCSTRSMKPEYGHSGNLKGYFLADGNTCLMKSGQEYYNISPVWNWNYIPGVTTPLLDEIPLQKTAFGCYGTSDFAGGASDSIYGVTSYKYFDDYNGINTGANKGYFFFDNEVVCLGSNIKSDHQLVTTVEQCWGGDNLSVLYSNSLEGVFSQLSGDVNFEKSVACVIHHGNAYYFPGKGADVICNNIEKQGNWYELDTSQKDTIIGGRVFLLAINHKMTDKCAENYSYIIVPGTDEKDMISYIKRDDIEIAANTDSVQSVRHRGLGIWEIIFYKGCSFKHHEIEVKANRPCTMILKKGKQGETLLHVADPGQTGQDIILDIYDKKNDVTYQGFVTYEDTPEIYWGLTKKVILSNNTPTGIKTIKSFHESEIVEGECYVFDMTGKLVMKTLDNKIGALNILKKGMYIIKNNSNNWFNSRKILLK